MLPLGGREKEWGGGGGMRYSTDKMAWLFGLSNLVKT